MENGQVGRTVSEERTRVNDDRLIQLLSDLVAIPSVNPVYDPASTAEIDMAAYVEAWARSLGLEVARQMVFPGRDNVLVRLDGPEGAPVLLMEAHMDTVGVDGMPHAFSPEVRDGHLHGRGACDTKGSLAAMMAAVERLAGERENLSCTVELLAAVDEETSGAGARAHVDAGGTADAAIIGEPTDARIVHEHNGCVRGEVEVVGKAAHTSVAGEGINAIEGMAEVILALRALNAEIAARPGGLADNGSLTVSLISGGAGINIVPERCTINYDRRVAPGHTSAAALAEIDAALDDVRKARPVIRIERPEPWFVGNSLATAPGSDLVRIAAAAGGALGLDGTPLRVPYGSDASKFQAGGIPAIVFGPGSIAKAHAIDESVPVAELVTAAAFYRQVALRFGKR
jgi:acetylornithine deacetylase